LPIGIKSENAKFTDNLGGSDPGAPKNPKIAKKFFITSMITSVIFLVIYYLVSQGYLNLRGYIQ
jgi:predicted secreted protein